MRSDFAPTLLVTADPDFLDLALAELQQAAPTAQALPLAEGVLLAATAQSFFELAETWRQAPPIFVRHICPVQVIAPLRAKLNADVSILRQAITDDLLPLVDPELSFSVQTRVLADLPYKPFDLNTPLAEIVSSTGAPLNVRAHNKFFRLSVRIQPTRFTQHATCNTPPTLVSPSPSTTSPTGRGGCGVLPVNRSR
ncbi:MAG: hypothetical protein R3E79_47005 [Caldilineaceae bacterium]